VGSAKHRQPRRQTITAGGLESRSDPTATGESRDQKEWVDERGPVAISSANRIRKPNEFAARSARSSPPIPVFPVHSHGGQSRVVAAGAGRTARTEARNMDLLHHLEATPQMRSQNATEPRCHNRPDRNGDTLGSGLAVEAEQAPDFGRIICGAYDMAAVGHRYRGGATLARSQSDDGDVSCRKVGHRASADFHPVTPALDYRPHPPRITMHDNHGIECRVIGEAVDCPPADRAQPDDGCLQCRTDQSSSSAGSSRHPPRWGGVPPVPRRRTTPATISVTPRVTSVRRRAFIWRRSYRACPYQPHKRRVG
jgi:hypothetical protein